MKKYFLVFSILTVLGFVLLKFIPLLYYQYLKMIGKRTVNDVITEIVRDVEPTLIKLFSEKNLNYPPKKLVLFAIKEERILEVWSEQSGDWKYLKKYQVLAASGELGPKLREGDRQVPEGIYKISGLNPNSSYHLSMKLNYPNEFDLKNADLDGRNNPGSNIFIHGKAQSVGCLAIGDKPIEELFFLVNKVGRENVEVVISPKDPEKYEFVVQDNYPDWTAELYNLIKAKSYKIRNN